MSNTATGGEVAFLRGPFEETLERIVVGPHPAGYSFDVRRKAISSLRHRLHGAQEPRNEGDAMTAERSGTRRRTSLSDKQQAILEVIQRSVATRGYPPRMREIGDAVGLSSLSSVTHQLNQLELAGYIRRDPNRPRALEVLIDVPNTEPGAESGSPVGDAAMVPLVGRIAAGIPITADQMVEEIVPLPRSLVGKGELFMLKVVGESMIDAAICDVDWAVVATKGGPQNGETL